MLLAKINPAALIEADFGAFALMLHRMDVALPRFPEDGAATRHQYLSPTSMRTRPDTTEGVRMKVFYAHSVKDQPESRWQSLQDHLTAVADLAKERAKAACPADTQLLDAAFAAGLLHDLGKYRPECQQMLRELYARNEHCLHKQAGTAKANWNCGC